MAADCIPELLRTTRHLAELTEPPHCGSKLGRARELTDRIVGRAPSGLCAELAASIGNVAAVVERRPEFGPAYEEAMRTGVAALRSCLEQAGREPRLVLSR
jgi:hypothetical protein